jgi:CRP-like cAMP-binding protein
MFIGLSRGARGSIHREPLEFNRCAILQAGDVARNKPIHTQRLALGERDLVMAVHAETPTPVVNQLFGALPEDVRERLSSVMEPMTFALGEIVYDRGKQMPCLYFPTSCVVSLIYTMEDGATAEMGLVGNEGVVGIALFLGAETAPNQAVAQVAGDAYRLPSSAMLEEFRRGGPFQLALLRYTQALIAQISQTAVCNRLHPIEKRLCRWLLLTRDRVPSDEILMTQEFIAHMLGVRREGVTAAARRLQNAGLIRYARGHIVISDQAGLEAEACECYRVVKAELERLLERGFTT